MNPLSHKFSAITQKLATNAARDIHQSLDAEVVRQLGQAWAKDVNYSGEAHDLAGYLARWRKRAIGTSAGLAVAGFGLIGITSSIDNVAVRLLTVNGAICCWFGGRCQRRTIAEADPVLGTLARIQAAQSAIALTQLWDKQPALIRQTAELEQPILDEPITTFDWGDIDRNPDQFPHLMLLGKTGSGKSILAEWLLKKLGGKLTAITPHATPKDWQGVRVVGGGRDFDSISAEFDLLIEEMDRRYALYSDGVTDFEFWNVAIDELPAIVAQCENVPDQLKVLIREARKVRIRLLLLTQGAEVKALKMEGEGSVRDSLTFIRLGNFATDHARKLKDKSLVAWLQGSDRPCLVDDVPAVVPNLA
jgi:hypothetical protein